MYFLVKIGTRNSNNPYEYNTSIKKSYTFVFAYNAYKALFAQKVKKAPPIFRV